MREPGPRKGVDLQDVVQELDELIGSRADLRHRVGLLDRGELLFLEPVSDVLARYDVETLEEAFFVATGRTFEDEKTEEDEEREVFA